MKFLNSFAFLFILLFNCLYVLGQTSEAKRSGHFNLEKGVALEGYDPVSYFENEEPKKGKKSLSHEYNGVTYRFSSEENKKLFLAQPEDYEPEYGGWCAYAMGLNGEKVGIDPETYKIKDGKLYLFYNAFFNNTLPKWNEDEENLKPKADQFWGGIIK
ncbi:YHS domain-containing (seleno)protein [Flexithrix dorotheae]|uniref:YHS domain-containing (seleno)protein n=1 Tax=Flexithrix dorotheae TaxID=70993 RepID=UPI00035CD204|nr:YHS domain-containing (seleno)protein [Flexithrix dorotheae]